MPEEPSMMYVYFGTDQNYDTSTGELKDGKFRYVIYIPFATSESTGLPEKPHAPGMPWIPVQTAPVGRSDQDETGSVRKASMISWLRQ